PIAASTSPTPTNPPPTRISPSRMTHSAQTAAGSVVLSGLTKPYCAVDPRGVAARRRVVDVQIGGGRIGEEPFDRGFQFAPIDQLPAGHHRVRVEGADGEGADAQLFGDGVDRVIGLLAAADIHREAH